MELHNFETCGPQIPEEDKNPKAVCANSSAPPAFLGVRKCIKDLHVCACVLLSPFSAGINKFLIGSCVATAEHNP